MMAYARAVQCTLLTIDYFAVVNLVTLAFLCHECEAEVNLVLIQTSFALLWKLSLRIRVSMRIT